MSGFEYELLNCVKSGWQKLYIIGMCIIFPVCSFLYLKHDLSVAKFCYVVWIQLKAFFFHPLPRAGPVQSMLMNSSHMTDGQAYNSWVPGVYSQQTSTKNPLHTSSGLYNYGGSQPVSSFSNYQGPGQTLNRPPTGSSLATIQPGPVTHMPPPLQNSAAVSTSPGSFSSGVNFPAHSNWQYGQTLLNQPTTGSPANHFAHPAATAATQPLLSSSGNTNLPTSYHYVSSPGGPPVQNSNTNQGKQRNS